MLTLPLQPAALIGRASELAELTDLLVDQRSRLVTLTGPGGAGKTRLALALAESISTEYPAGVCLVDLTSLPRGATPELVWAATAHALGLADDADRGGFELVRDYLAERRLLLLLDNVEHVLESTLEVSRLLERCPGVQVLATSREPMRLRWELTYAVPALDPSTAVELFEERARAVDPRFALDDAGLAIVTELCDRLDRLPLAIELAAARCRALTPRAILARLERRLALLTSSIADLPTRHQTLRATIAWSYDLLDDDERELFRALAVFVGSFTADAAAAVVSPLDVEAGHFEIVERLDAAGRAELAAGRHGADRRAAVLDARVAARIRARTTARQRRGGRRGQAARQLLPRVGRTCRAGAAGTQRKPLAWTARG